MYNIYIIYNIKIKKFIKTNINPKFAQSKEGLIYRERTKEDCMKTIVSFLRYARRVFSEAAVQVRQARHPAGL